MKTNHSGDDVITVDFIATEPVVSNGLTIIEADTVEHRIKLDSDTDYTVIEPLVTGPREISTTAECEVRFENGGKTQLDARDSIKSEMVGGVLIVIARKNANVPSWDELRREFNIPNLKPK